jgi:hypothetical protein
MNRTLIAFFAVGCVLIVARILAGCGALTPAEQATVTSDGVKLSMCATQAHMCKLAAGDDAGPWDACWKEYVDCKANHGFDGGAK